MIYAGLYQCWLNTSLEHGSYWLKTVNNNNYLFTYLFIVFVVSQHKQFQYSWQTVLFIYCKIIVFDRNMAVVVGPYFIGVDIGTSSVRAALITSTGRLVCSASSAITIWEPEPTFYEQSSTDIWQACCTVVRVRRSEFSHIM